MRSPGRYIGAAGMNAPPTQGPVLVGKVHQVLKDEFDFYFSSAQSPQLFHTQALPTHSLLDVVAERGRYQAAWYFHEYVHVHVLCVREYLHL